MHCCPWKESIMQYKLLICLLTGFGGFNLWTYGEKNLFPESPDLPPVERGYVFSLLNQGDDRERSILKLQQGGYLGYRELHSNLIKSPVRWDGHAFELTCKYNHKGLLELCLIQGESGWQDFFYDDIVHPQWLALRTRVTRTYGKPVEITKFPAYQQVPYNDKGGFVTDRWELKDRTLLLSLQSYSQEDCCTGQVLDFSCCILLIQPK